jgi:hypothetical protein
MIKKSLLPDDDSIGLAIDVEFISIGTTHKEYLVPFELLKKNSGELGLNYWRKKILMILGLNSSTNTFDVSYEMARKRVKRLIICRML